MRNAPRATSQDALASGLPAIAYISVADLPYWHLPSEESGMWGYTIVVYGQQSDRFLIDDRNLKPLSLPGPDLSASRGRIPSYKNRLLVVDPATVELDNDALLAGGRVRPGRPGRAPVLQVGFVLAPGHRQMGADAHR